MTETCELWKPDAPQLRDYQQSIYERAKETDLLVVIPTGLGKTYIAAMLSAFKLAQYPHSKIIILAPTRPLINQHLESLVEVINLDETHFTILSGKVST